MFGIFGVHLSTRREKICNNDPIKIHIFPECTYRSLKMQLDICQRVSKSRKFRFSRKMWLPPLPPCAYANATLALVSPSLQWPHVIRPRPRGGARCGSDTTPAFRGRRLGGSSARVPHHPSRFQPCCQCSAARGHSAWHMKAAFLPKAPSQKGIHSHGCALFCGMELPRGRPEGPPPTSRSRTNAHSSPSA